MKNGRVSIVIPVYNAERYVAEAVESALNQTYGNCEVIAVVDGGSTDGSREAVEGFSDGVTVVTTPHTNTAGGLNAGMRRMSGEWFKWLAADDRLKPNCVRDLVGTATCIGDVNRIYHGGIDLVDGDGNVLMCQREPDLNSMSQFDRNVRLLHQFYGNPNASLIHKSAFDRFGGFDEGVPVCEDYEMWLRLCVLHDFRMHHVPKIVADYRLHGGQISEARGDEARSQKAAIIAGVLDQVDPLQAGRYLDALELYRQSRPVSSLLFRYPWRLVKRVLPAKTVLKVGVSCAARKRRGSRV